jgi:hypothetical protein
MSQPRRMLGFVSALTLGIAILNAKAAYAGPERISLGLSGYSVYVSGSQDLVPVNVKLANGSPDYIDMTYSAQDVNGNPVSCTPASNRFYMTKSTPTITDNVIVNAGAVPVLFMALAQGECVGADGEGSTQYLGGFSFGTPAVTVGTAVQLHKAHYIVPVTASLSSGTNTVRLKYSAVDSTTGTAQPVECRPIHDDFNLMQGANAGRNVLCLVGNTQSAAVFPVVFTVKNAADTTIVQYSILQTTPGSAQSGTIGTLTVTAGPSVQVVSQWSVPITMTPTFTGRVKLCYSAYDPSGNSYPCNPSISLFHGKANTALYDQVRVDTTGASSNNVKLTAVAVSVDEENHIYDPPGVSQQPFGP